MDVTHCKDHLRNIARALHPDIEPGVISGQASQLLNNLVEIIKEKGPLNLITNLKLLKPKGKGVKNKLKIWNRELAYIEKNKHRMDYPDYIKRNFPIGSGVVEGAIKLICNKRLKQSSAYWIHRNIDGLLKFRIIWFNNYFDSFWKFRSNNLKNKVRHLYA